MLQQGWILFTLNSSDIGDIPHKEPFGASDHDVLNFEYLAELTVENAAA